MRRPAGGSPLSLGKPADSPPSLSPGGCAGVWQPSRLNSAVPPQLCLNLYYIHDGVATVVSSHTHSDNTG